MVTISIPAIVEGDEHTNYKHLIGEFEGILPSQDFNDLMNNIVKIDFPSDKEAQAFLKVLKNRNG